MPDLTTHHLFGEIVFDDLNQDIKDIINKHKNVFNVGLQGPDLLFFHNALKPSFSNQSNLPRLASKMHTELIKEVLNYMKMYIATLEHPSTEHDILTSYYLGYICHYFLDKTVHPYVYFLVDKVCKRFPKLTQTSVHVKIEAEIDTIFYNKLKSKCITTFSVRNNLTVSTVDKNIIGKMYSDMIRELFDEDIEILRIMKCFDDMVNTSVLFYDKTKILSKASKIVNSILPISKDLTNHIKPLEVKADTANLNCNLWHHPLYQENKSHKSVLSLFYDAKEDVVETINDLYPLLNSQTPLLFDTSLDFHGNKII